MIGSLDAKIPSGPIETKWERHKFDSKLINHIDTGRPIELQVDELHLTAEILPTEVHPYPTSKAVQAAPPIYAFKPASRTGKPPVMPPPPLIKPDFSPPLTGYF